MRDPRVEMSCPTSIFISIMPEMTGGQMETATKVEKLLSEFIAASGLEATWNDELVGVVRCHVFDPFGNRLELVQA